VNKFKASGVWECISGSTLLNGTVSGGCRRGVALLSPHALFMPAPSAETRAAPPVRRDPPLAHHQLTVTVLC
jgi:hypothetical protein